MQFNFLSFFTILSILFGNAAYGGFDLFFYFFLPLIFTLSLFSRDAYIINSSILKNFIYFLVLLTVSVFQFFNIEVPYNEIYWLWPLKSIIIFFILCFNNFSWPDGNNYLFLAFILFLLIFGFISPETGRFESFFGSNMLYRFFGLMFLISIFLIDNKKLHIKIFALILTLFCLNLTGSVGAVLPVSFAFVLLILNRDSPNIGSGLIIFFSMILFIMLILYFFESSIIYRFQYKFFQLEEVPRFLIWSQLINEISIFGKNYYDFIEFWFFGFQYPHNFIIELLVYGGYFVTPLILMILIAAVKSLKKINIFSLTFFILILGASLSGDLSDNWGVIALAFALLCKSIQDNKKIGTIHA